MEPLFIVSNSGYTLLNTGDFCNTKRIGFHTNVSKMPFHLAEAEAERLSIDEDVKAQIGKLEAVPFPVF